MRREDIQRLDVQRHVLELDRPIPNLDLLRRTRTKDESPQEPKTPRNTTTQHEERTCSRSRRGRSRCSVSRRSTAAAPWPSADNMARARSPCVYFAAPF